MRLSNRRPKVLIAPVTYRGSTEATYTYQGVKHNCDYVMEPTKHKLVGVMWLTPNGLRVQWNLVPVGRDCPDEVHPSPSLVPTLPTKSMVTKVPVPQVLGRRQSRCFALHGASTAITLVWSANV